MILPAPIRDLINAFSRLPGIGPKTASRLTFYLLTAPDDLSQDLAAALSALKTQIAYCQTCFNITITGQTQCEICTDADRDQDVICVVEEPLDVLAIERTEGFHGRYHVLQGVLSPIEGIGPEDLKIRELLTRVSNTATREIILATNPSMEGDATAMYLRRQLASSDVRVTRLARGLPVGGDLEYADPHTLMRALDGRQEMEN
jgi:recombination protein RecR